MKSLQLLTYLACMLFTLQVSAQNPGWTTCSSTAGTLDGSMTAIYMTDTTPQATFVVSPSPSSAIPQTEFLVILLDSMAADTMGSAIVGTSLLGNVSPQDLGLAPGDTFALVAFSYDIAQIKDAVDGILNNSVPFLGSCCNLLDAAAPVPGICDSLNNAGINGPNDVNNINDLLTFLGAFAGGGSTSLRGLNAVLVGINDQIGTLNTVGCTNGVGEVCYATDSLAVNQAHFVVTTMVSTMSIEGNSALQIAVSPNPFMDYISTGIMTQDGGEHTLRVFDATGRTVHQEVKVLSAGEQNVRINLGNLPAGLYYLQVADQRNIATQKIIKR
jgi:hypothetical protein